MALLVKDVNEILEDLEVEGRRQHLAPRVPFGAGAGQQTRVQPRLKELILARLLYQLVTAQ